MKYLTIALLLMTAGTSHAGGCIRTGDIDMLLPLSDGRELRKIFPTLRYASIPDRSNATLQIGQEDCDAPDVEQRRVRAEKLIGQPVILILNTDDFVLIPRGNNQIMRKIVDIFPSAKLRGQKIDEDAEVIFIGPQDIDAPDVAERRAKVEEILGKPVYLRRLR
ncbi:hypothetical protein NRY95_05720 [Xanthomonas campestris pv. phormiicola]|nr:hypothetical protein [Xanthomonas campestris pv. phormiicola]UYC17460.1 hypothetical protein NRY95_05720 [Xanthomonas campestris pv. phormiicola]